MKFAEASRRMAALLLVVVSVPTAAIAAPCDVRHDEVNFFRDIGKSAALQSKIQFNKRLMREKITAKVSGRVAILSGNVSSRESIRLAEQIARQRKGIRCVQNWLKVGPPLDTFPTAD